MANDYLVSFFYWDKRKNENSYTPTLILNDSIVGLKKKTEDFVKQCDALERNPLSMFVRYVGGGRFGGSEREVLSCTIHEFFNMCKDE